MRRLRRAIHTPWTSVRIKLLTVVMLASLSLAFDGDSRRAESLATKLRCTCGCGEILAECSHTKCESKKSLKVELADAVGQGLTDEKVVDLMGTRHGAAILLTPSFNGFNTLLWIVPIAVIFVRFRFRPVWAARPNRHRRDGEQ